MGTYCSGWQKFYNFSPLTPAFIRPWKDSLKVDFLEENVFFKHSLLSSLGMSLHVATMEYLRGYDGSCWGPIHRLPKNNSPGGYKGSGSLIGAWSPPLICPRTIEAVGDQSFMVGPVDDPLPCLTPKLFLSILWADQQEDPSDDLFVCVWAWELLDIYIYIYIQ